MGTIGASNFISSSECCRMVRTQSTRSVFPFIVDANNPDGRSYYYNSKTNVTTWEKPDALKTPAEIRLAKIPWKEYTTPEGRKYWNNSETGESVWSMPQAYKDAINGPAKPNGYRYSSTFLMIEHPQH